MQPFYAEYLHFHIHRNIWTIDWQAVSGPYVVYSKVISSEMQQRKVLEFISDVELEFGS